jgi:predicted Fe-Mo cluster-binding NifX family protein
MTENIRRIAIASEDDRGLDGQVSQHFGRCPFYTVVDVSDGAVGAVRVTANPHYEAHRPGVVPHFVQGLGAHVIVAGGMGPRAIALFNDFGIEVATGAIGRTGAVLEAYLAGRVRGIVPCHHDHPESCGGHG